MLLPRGIWFLRSSLMQDCNEDGPQCRCLTGYRSISQYVVHVPSGTRVCHHDAGIPQHNGSARNIEENISPGTDQDLSPDCDFSYQNRVRSNPDAVFDRRSAFAWTRARRTNSHALRNIYIFPQHRIRTDDDPSEMPDI